MAIQPLFNARRDSLSARRLVDPGWLLMPLRLFLGVTFSYAGLQKLANPAYLDPHNPASVMSQMRVLRQASPIGALLQASTHAPTLVGLLIAFGELGVGVGTLAAFWLRPAAVGGALLSLTFFLTVSWNTTPYYYGSDIVFVFAWLTILGVGDTGALSLHAWVTQHAWRPRPHARAARPTATELDRRAVLQTGLSAASLGGATLALGGITAALGRAVGRSRPEAQPALTEPSALTSPPAPASSGASSPPNGPASAVAGIPIGSAAEVAVGQAKSFTDPASGSTAWIVHASPSTFVAFNAACTHAGCPVQFDPANIQFLCPCHGGVYDARTGAVLQGPPPAPLQSIPVHVVAGQLRVDR